MACTALFTCDYEGCLRALDERDVTQVHLCVHSAQMPQDPEMSLGLALDLCDEHLDVVLARILTSAGSTSG
jgi:hypothetical protein